MNIVKTATRHNMRRLFLIAVLIMPCSFLKAQMLALKTNALMDAALVPNIGLELATGSKTSLAANGFASWNIYGMTAKTYGFAPEFRYWLSGNTFSKLFVGIGATMAHYDIAARKTEYFGSAYGGGINVGYNYWLSKHFSVEFHGGVGVYYYHHASFPVTEVINDIPKYNDSGWTLLPYQLGVSFVYVIK